ncbi:ABC transporter permease [Nitratireductor soli]|uniref:ABC transporter permease n=1 Tax=Nitratireductor soli TaxID=1670619 RepID=UPI00065DF961|nr:ABC transporter permease [Nitratireductor soli]
MGMFIVKRLGVTALVLLVTSMISFSLIHLAGDPAVAMAGERATPEQIETIRRLYGFDRPFHEQYLHWVGNVLEGNLGRSNYLKEEVAPILARHLPVTAQLGVLALAFALFVSIPLGVIAALRPNSLIDRAALVIAVTGQSMPSFLSSIALIFGFGVMLRWLPISGTGSFAHYILPAIALGYYASPAIMRLTRSGMIEVLQSDHVRTARAYGLSAWQMIVRHGLRHAIIPVVSVATVQFGYMLGGSVVVEAVFSMDGIGNLAWLSIRRYDVEVIQAILLIVAATYALLALAADLLNAVLDPRIRV